MASAPEPQRPAQGPAGAPEGWREVRFRASPSFVEALRQLSCSLLVSTYQAGKLLAVGTTDAGLHISFHSFDRAMGVAVHPRQLAVGAMAQIWFLADNSQLAPALAPPGRFDRLYLARTATVTGSIHCHEIAWGGRPGEDPELWVVNTLFSCLATLHPEYSFVPRWRPPFVSRLAAEDRCHLNGVAMRDGRPAFVTAMAASDEPAGWRADKNDSGRVLDVESGEAVTEGLAMPHSPRWNEGSLLVLNSGHGALESVDLAGGGREAIATVPGYARGLALHGNLAFIGLSRIRETAVFGGVPLAERHDELKCGVGVVDLTSGATVASLEFESGVEEIFDVQVVPGARCLALGGQRPDQDAADDIWVVPPEGAVPAPAGPGSGDAPAASDPGPEPAAAGPGAAPAATAAGPGAAPAPVAAGDDEVRGWVAQALGLQGERRAGEALALLERAAAARPESAEILNHLGNALQDSGRQEEALATYRRAVEADPGFAPALQNLGYLLIQQGDTEQGIERLRRAQRVDPAPVNEVLIATALPVIYGSTDQVDRAHERLLAGVGELARAGLSIDTARSLAPTTFFAAYQGRDLRAMQEDLGRIYRGQELVGRGRRGGPGRPRIGFLSAYFRNHTIGRLNLGRIERLSRERFEVVVLSVGRHRDPMAAAFEAAADRFVVVPREVEAARRLIAEQQLDLLLFADVGMDALTSTLAYSRMAPVQCVTWGHPVTTGSPQMDLFLSSELLEDEGARAHYSEELVLRPTLATYYRRPQAPPAEGARAALGLDGVATLYACPQTLYKLHPELDPLLAEILRRDPAGRLLLIEGRVARWTALARERLARTMPDGAERVDWVPTLEHADYLRLLAAADVILDPIHFSGGNSSYEALAVGTPVITWPSAFLRGRITRALYAKAGYTDLVADSGEEYVELAVGLGTDEERRRAARERLAEATDSLFEDEAEVRDLEDFLAWASA